MGKDRSKKIIIRKQRCEPTSSSTQTIICSQTPSCLSDKCDGCGTSCGSSSSSSSCSDPKMYLIEATKSSSSSSSSSDSCRKSSKECRVIYTPVSGCNSSNNCYGSAYYNFCAVVRPVRNFALVDGRSCSDLKLNVSINSRSVTIQWEGFTGQVDASGQAYLYINQSFRGMPAYSVYGSCVISFKGGYFMSAVEVLPRNDNTIRWYLSPALKGTSVTQGDSFTILGGSVSYIMSDECC